MSSLLVGQALRDLDGGLIFQIGHEGSFTELLRSEHQAYSIVAHNNWLRTGIGWRFLRNLWRERWAVAEFHRAFADLKPSLVYVNTAVSFAAAQAAHRLGIPVVWHLRELFSDEGGELKVPRLFRRWVARKIRQLATVTVSPTALVCRNFFQAESLLNHVVIPNAVAAEEFHDPPSREEARRRLVLPVDVPLVGVAGTFRKVKGQDVLIRAIPAIRDQVPDCEFAFTGGPSEFRGEMEQLARELGVADRCHFVGEVQVMKEFYSAMDLVCVPSRSESFGRTAIEAFAARRPVIAARAGGLRDIIRDGRNGVFFESENIGELSAKVVELLNGTAAARQAIIDAGRRDFEERFNEEAHAARIRELVGSVLSRSCNTDSSACL